MDETNSASTERTMSAHRETHRPILGRITPSGSMVRKVLLALGIVGPLFYVATDILLATRWKGYSYTDQTVSELFAIGAPTRPLAVLLMLTYGVLAIAFGLGVWASAGEKRALRVVAVGLIGAGDRRVASCIVFLDYEMSVGSKEEAPMSSAEENKVLVRRFLEAQANADPDALEELLVPDFVDHDLQPDQEPGREGFIRAVAEEPDIFSNLRVNILDQVAEGDKVTTRFTWRRIHDRGEFLGLAPTGMEIKTTAIVINRVSGGKIVEEWSESTGVLEATRQRLEQERLERERIEQELQLARSIQQASLPKEVPSLQGWHINPHYHPAREVGGDFYDFHLLSENRLGVVVGDATGKGVPAALVMASARSMLRALAQASNSPGEVLSRVNDA